MIIILDDIGGSKSRDGARARARTGTPTFFLDQTEARRAGKNDFRSRISLLSLSLGQSNNEEFKFATWKTRRELEPKCVPQKLLGSLLGMRRSAIGRPSNIPRSLCERKSTQFLSRFLSGESPQPPCDKKRPLQRKGRACGVKTRFKGDNHEENTKHSPSKSSTFNSQIYMSLNSYLQ